MNILVTNDDGIEFIGNTALSKKMAELGNVYRFAPIVERSATSQALTIFDNIEVIDRGNNAFEISGYPADCVNVALHSNLISEKIDLVVSGINKGENMGEDVIFSGTVAAARHAFIHGVPALAVSCGYIDENGDYDSVAQYTLDLLKDKLLGFEKPFFLNLNYPVYKPVKGLKWAKLGHRIYRDTYKEVEVNGNRKKIFLGGSILSYEKTPGTDFGYYDEGYATLTPLTLDTTDYEELRRYQ